ncbi:hypothetical protein C2G38_2152518 [Gigaspora rosea]|uniref:Uncharacterized protein n=1 Tax=Gigaspora rosea TaxID=44941 RepID=A0A397W767_9GLOM|nr:hypothetical protein C2G38_2152518 [Gigaspora rosea]
MFNEVVGVGVSIIGVEVVVVGVTVIGVVDVVGTTIKSANVTGAVVGAVAEDIVGTVFGATSKA